MAFSFEELEQALQANGPAPALDKLCEALRQRREYHGLFYTRLLAKRLELGLQPVQPGGSDDIPRDVQPVYEEAIRTSAREAGGLYLDDGDIPAAWQFFRMIGEPQKVKDAIAKADPDDAELRHGIVQIALGEGVHPTRGFDLVLKHQGICSAITTFGQELAFNPAVREHCVQELVRALHHELTSRLRPDVQQREPNLPENATIKELVEGRDWLFEDDMYHIDTSHLSAVVQYGVFLSPGPELQQAIDLCEYGKRLSPRFQHQGESPFENQYHDYQMYLRALAGENADEAVAHFLAKAENANPEEVGTYPAEVYVTLLARLKRYREAADAFVRFLAQADVRRLNCPPLPELCQHAGDYSALVEVSRRRGDLVNFAAAMLQSQRK